MKEEIYITGATGQLGGEIQRLFPEATYLTRNDIDLSNPQTITNFFQNKSPDIIINCAAYTQVDLAETNVQFAHQINAVSPGVLAQHSKKFIHISTDYVFNGEGYKPYLEGDLTSPLGQYGKSKLEGEKLVLVANPDSVILRTSWVYSDIGKNFVKTMLKLGKEKEEIKVVWDQIGCPTSAHDLAQVIVDYGIKSWGFKDNIYNFTNEGVASWYDFAKEVFEIKGIRCKVLPINSKDYPTPAKRPHYSVLDKAKIKNDLGIEIPHWKESLKKCLQKLS